VVDLLSSQGSRGKVVEERFPGIRGDVAFKGALDGRRQRHPAGGHGFWPDDGRGPGYSRPQGEHSGDRGAECGGSWPPRPGP